MDVAKDKGMLEEKRLKRGLQDPMEIYGKKEMGAYTWSEEGLGCLRESLQLIKHEGGPERP